ncbi:hypothetical protein Droror1_Dr00022531 [Drosera rotundifolia]
MDPEYQDTGVSTKVDVFSYGVVVLELITGKKFYDNNRPAENRSLLSMFMRSQVHTTADLIDPTLDRNEETLRSFEKVARLACNCCIRDSDQRPEISDVMSVLLPLVRSWMPLENA